jgi:serine/threonine protein kinase
MQLADSVKNHKTDMFSLGVVVAEIGSGRRPNPGPAMRQTGPRTFEAVDEEDRRAGDIAAIQHEPLKHLARRLIRHEPADRLSAEEVLALDD